MLVPYGLAETKYYQLIFLMCVSLFVSEGKIFSPVEILYNILLVLIQFVFNNHLKP